METKTNAAESVCAFRLTNEELVIAIEKANENHARSGTEKGKLWLCHLEALLKIQLARAEVGEAWRRLP